MSLRAPRGILKWRQLFDTTSQPLSFLFELLFILYAYSVFMTCMLGLSFVIYHEDCQVKLVWHYCKNHCMFDFCVTSSLSSELILYWFCMGYYLSSLIANSMPPAMDTWGSCLASAARSIGVRYVHGPKMTPAIPSTSLPSSDTRLAWLKLSERYTVLASVSTSWLDSASWLHGRLEETYLMLSMMLAQFCLAIWLRRMTGRGLCKSQL